MKTTNIDVLQAYLLHSEEYIVGYNRGTVSCVRCACTPWCRMFLWLWHITVLSLLHISLLCCCWLSFLKSRKNHTAIRVYVVACFYYCCVDEAHHCNLVLLLWWWIIVLLQCNDQRKQKCHGILWHCLSFPLWRTVQHVFTLASSSSLAFKEHVSYSFNINVSGKKVFQYNCNSNKELCHRICPPHQVGSIAWKCQNVARPCKTSFLKLDSWLTV